MQTQLEQEKEVAKSLKDWLQEGEELYSAAMRDYQSIESQLEQLEAQLASKKEELNQIAQVVGKPPVDSNRRPAVQIVDREGPGSIPASRNTIAKALTGRGLG
jgi:chromosome segregation ATPase